MASYAFCSQASDVGSLPALSPEARAPAASSGEFLSPEQEVRARAVTTESARRGRMIDEHTVRFEALHGRAGDDVTYTERRVRSVRAPALVLWQVVHDLGGESGYHAFDSLWRARAAVDRAVGGPGMRGRPEELADGDALDFWRVESVDPPQRLLLRAEMRMPGTARLELAGGVAGGHRVAARAAAPGSSRPASSGTRSGGPSCPGTRWSSTVWSTASRGPPSARRRPGDRLLRGVPGAARGQPPHAPAGRRTGPVDRPRRARRAGGQAGVAGPLTAGAG